MLKYGVVPFGIYTGVCSFLVKGCDIKSKKDVITLIEKMDLTNQSKEVFSPIVTVDCRDNTNYYFIPYFIDEAHKAKYQVLIICRGDHVVTGEDFADHKIIVIYNSDWIRRNANELLIYEDDALKTVSEKMKKDNVVCWVVTEDIKKVRTPFRLNTSDYSFVECIEIK